MVASIIGTAARAVEDISGRGIGGGRLGPEERKEVALEVLGGRAPVAVVARAYQVSRPFVYRQADKAEQALGAAFDPPPPDAGVLRQVAITHVWVRQMVLELALVGHCSFRAIQEVLREMLGVSRSLGTIHGIVQEAIAAARKRNPAEDLSAVRVGAHDEIYQNGNPVLVGVDVDSLYCYLLSPEAHCDETTWGVRLLELNEQGLDLQRVIADGGKGLRAGHAAAWPTVPCDGDVFHAEMELSHLVGFLDHQARRRREEWEDLQRRAWQLEARGQVQPLAVELQAARQKDAEAAGLARDVRTIADWMCQDVLALGGPNLATRQALFDWLVDELRRREALCDYRIRPVRRLLEHYRDQLLGFARVLEARLVDVADRLGVPAFLVHQVCELQGLDPESSAFWQRKDRLHHRLGRCYYEVEKAVRQAMADTPRASSAVENLNSRLRDYFFLRQEIGHGYLDLLRFFLNHHRFSRSQRPERVGKSPAERLTGHDHPHWMELLGFGPLPVG